ncbi:MAG: hypothetical protein ACJ75B_13545 [Flavisolibacter sp.]
MTKKDGDVQENTDLGKQKDDRKEETTQPSIEFTEVKNANASGLGSIGKSDEQEMEKAKGNDPIT